MNKKTLLILLVVLIGLFICGMVSLYILNSKSTNFNVEKFELEKISKDLRSQISEGNCETYTNFYKEAFEQLGIKTYQVIIPVSAEENNGVISLEGHTFLIVYSSEGYCKLDQEKKCRIWKNLTQQDI